MMENYKIYFEGPYEREKVERILEQTNDVIIDSISDYSVVFTIQHEDAPMLYRILLDQIDREVFLHRPHVHR